MVVGIGEGGSNIPVEEALKQVYGYNVGVDPTRRDLQKEAKDMRRTWDTSKGFDLSAPCGLLIPVKEREGCIMEMTLNGNVVQKTELRKMIWKVKLLVPEKP
jgi:fumarylpyruvate hydrolase